jgi:hypothetical protein
MSGPPGCGKETAASLAEGAKYLAGSVSNNTSLEGGPLTCRSVIVRISFMSTELVASVGCSAALIATITAVLITRLAATLLVKLEWEMKLRKAAALSGKNMMGFLDHRTPCAILVKAERSCVLICTA